MAPLGPSPSTFHVYEQPALQPFADGEHWRLIQPLVVRFGEGADSLVIPAGFVTDFATIPPMFQRLVSKLGPHIRPAIIHDYLYWIQACSRHEADVIFSKTMKDMGTSWFTRKAMYFAVANFGRKAWYENAQHRAAGLPRVIPPDARDIGPYETWARYRTYLTSLGEDMFPEPVITPGFCTCTRVASTAGSAGPG
jgi:hypothetical protein